MLGWTLNRTPGRSSRLLPLLGLVGTILASQAAWAGGGTSRYRHACNRTYRTVTASTGYAEWAGTYDRGARTNPMMVMDFEIGYRIKREIIDELGRRESALDVGSGTGRAIALLERNFKKVVATDLSPEMLERAEYRAHKESTEFVVGDFLNLTDLGQHDFVHSSLVMKYFGDLRAFFRRIHASLAPGGRAFIFDTSDRVNANPKYRTANGTETRITSYRRTPDEVLEAARAAGLEVQEWNYLKFVEDYLETNPSLETYVGSEPVYYFVFRRAQDPETPTPASPAKE